MTSSAVTFEMLREQVSPTALEHFDPGRTYETQRVSASSLVVANRFDLPVKISFAQRLLEGRTGGYYEQLYSLHLALWNGFFESWPPKANQGDFQTSFSQLIENRHTIDFGSMMLPVDKNFSLIDGAHRAALAAALEKEVTVVISSDSEVTYNANFFQSRCSQLSETFRQKAIDLMAYEFCRHSPSTRMIAIMPSTKGERSDEIETLIKSRSTVVYKRAFALTPTVFDLFILHCYWEDGTKWIGSFEDGFFGTRDKASRCYHPDHKLQIYLVQGLSNEESINLKTEIRNLFPLEKDSCHISDRHSELKTIAGLLFTSNFETLSQISLEVKRPKLAKAVSALSELVNNGILDREQLCIGGSALWALMGIRDCNDLDLLLPEAFNAVSLREELGNHKSQAAYYPTSFDEIISDPTYHFRLFGIKFIKPEVALRFKRSRGEVPKDTRDVLSLLERIPALEYREIEPLITAKDLETAAHSTLQDQVREQDMLIHRYIDRMESYYRPELGKLERQLTAALETNNEQARRIAQLEDNLSFLERTLSSQKGG